MPQIILKNTDRTTAAALAPQICETVARIIDVPAEHIVVEYSPVEFFRGGTEDRDSIMAWIYWKKRTQKLQKDTADALAALFKENGYTRSEIVYINLDMNDFYAYE